MLKKKDLNIEVYPARKRDMMLIFEIQLLNAEAISNNVSFKDILSTVKNTYLMR